jgi:amidophosphoribosyltransferase
MRKDDLFNFNRKRGGYKMCSIFGVIALKTTDPKEVIELGQIGANDLQHRGLEWVGVAFSGGNTLQVEKQSGLVASLFGNRNITGKMQEASPQMMMFQTRFSTQGTSTAINAQPHYMRQRWGMLALGSNGDIPDYDTQRARLEKARCRFISRNDSEALLHHIILNAKDNPDQLHEGILSLMREVPASFSAWLATENSVYLFRDPFANRPLYYMRIGSYFVFASEDCALHAILVHRADQGHKDGTIEINQVLPGEIIRITMHGEIEYLAGVEPQEKLAMCTFERVYFARPDGHVFGAPHNGTQRLFYKLLVRHSGDDRYMIEMLTEDIEEIGSFRFRLGKQLAREFPVEDADCVISIPDSGNFAAQGFAAESGIPYQIGLVRIATVARTFMVPGREARMRQAALKYRLMRGLFAKHRRIVVVDDSLVYGTTFEQLARMFMAAGAEEVHARLSCPPVTAACPYGIDMSSKGPLVAADMPIKQIREQLGVTSLQYLSLEGMQKVLGAGAENFCTGCWTGEFPIT